MSDEHLCYVPVFVLFSLLSVVGDTTLEDNSARSSESSKNSDSTRYSASVSGARTEFS